MMSVNQREEGYGVYGFHFYDALFNDIANILLLGRDKKTPGTVYDWYGMKREDVGTYVFQYTLSGTGQIQIEGTNYALKPGEAFIVEIPSDHRYYLPEDSDGWEFIFITLVGSKAAECWRFARARNGSVLKISPDSKLIHLLFRIYQDTAEQKITDVYHASSKAYEFMMELYRFVWNLEKSPNDLSIPIAKTLSYIQANYAEPIALNDIAAASGYSRYYFLKQFQKELHMTPIQYLTKIRVQKAADLLLATTHSVNEIALQVGYSNANYFNKVFRKAVGLSAGKFRRNKIPSKIDHLIID
ncbi:AraC family transcriptional regulator [Terribacillus saccharophilus]|uniref:AraC family transcriptional regulator n=2 Tax=Terribacillus saccharophilus TaxID=361277 RepID=A0A268ABQ1_9BACI|nr:AraC family transcriptional regulator [Terribacillus saccharophilus]PAF16949.1 AraC family transcriptional regulator [Terribacillus saccharophilus]PAF21260.1 AraC family transcriptional regulator [Terribacillus saccharophilus]PAF34346.1 AraC family transcriptional regulator [Terribacillus saccharophilus]PAF36452.1 AraC family transcriptional regulator [Terribacillus saccharophilus]